MLIPTMAPSNEARVGFCTFSTRNNHGARFFNREELRDYIGSVRPNPGLGEYQTVIWDVLSKWSADDISACNETAS